MFRRVPQLLVGAVMCFVLLAGLAKLANVPVFAEALTTWSIIPAALRGPLALLVPLLEVAVGGLWLIRWQPRRMEFVAAAILLVFTGAYMLQVALHEPPECGCLGELLSAERRQGEAKAVVVRNGALMAILFGGLLVRGRAGSALDTSPPAGEVEGGPAYEDVGHRFAGFTLIEMVLVIAILGILISLMAPSLARVRDSARGVVSLSQIRQHATIMTTYTLDWDDTWPNFTYPDATYTILSAGDYRARTTYFGARSWWFFALADSYYDGNPAHPSFFPPGYNGKNPAYQYTVSFLADARYWNRKTRTGSDQWRSVRVDEVTFPSQKGLLISWAPFLGGDEEFFLDQNVRVETAFCDGSAQFVRHADFLRPVPDGPGPFTGSQTQQFGKPVIHTMDGSRGRDIR